MDGNLERTDSDLCMSSSEYNSRGVVVTVKHETATRPFRSIPYPCKSWGTIRPHNLHLKVFSKKRCIYILSLSRCVPDTLRGSGSCFIRIEEVNEVWKAWPSDAVCCFWIIIRELRVVSLSLSPKGEGPDPVDSTTWYCITDKTSVATRELKRNRVAERSE